ncbi:MAG TPA: hypothetical protein VMW35_10010 [Myxococcota bacterium]|nr:hypothetical protein [Myxococcota bacterium]
MKRWKNAAAIGGFVLPLALANGAIAGTLDGVTDPGRPGAGPMQDPRDLDRDGLPDQVPPDIDGRAPGSMDPGDTRSDPTRRDLPGRDDGRAPDRDLPGDTPGVGPSGSDLPSGPSDMPRTGPSGTPDSGAPGFGTGSGSSER